MADHTDGAHSREQPNSSRSDPTRPDPTFATPPTLDEFVDYAWTQLVRGVKDRKHGFHQPVLCTAHDGVPDARTVVLRGVDRETREIRCHTDRRSPKVEQIRANPEVVWCFYDRSKKLQVRVRATATVLSDGPVFERAWASTRPMSRRCYLAPLVPGERLSEHHPNLPDELRDRDPTTEESDAGRASFAVIQTSEVSLDVLYLAHTGHRRAVELVRDHDITRSWSAP